ncbi:type II toxin-antitoxin system ChpB family toxin [Paraneptunicella aestuarii]|uniref:type II toxin-antitoxin system ChpB family toxin n=1 Tax=Paraneptunicella aestuarii TaxID=2831148 RepID=UPI001E39B10C|nr:type II toxin-antitoxin system ChpB family toxin [Paraneptunicella aestuarii]UAA39530.1 type II toxin-antitoxin system ChpB family toxin [Paraneptunicella aestuarii]
MAVFERGDIVRVCLNPTSGKEVQGDFRPCLVLSPKSFNKLGITLIAPITQGGDFSRFKGFTVALMGAGTETQGVILVNAIRMVDLQARKAKKLEQTPANIVEEVLAILGAILE